MISTYNQHKINYCNILHPFFIVGLRTHVFYTGSSSPFRPATLQMLGSHRCLRPVASVFRGHSINLPSLCTFCVVMGCR